MKIRKPMVRTLVPLCVAALLAACGGGDSAPNPPVPPAPPPVAPAPPGVLIGAAGGTVLGPSGARVVIPAGALSTEVRINIEVATSGAPPIPAGLTAVGQMFAFTPHGTTFALPVTMTLPFDPATVPPSSSPVFFKTINGQTQWERVASPSFGASSVSAQVTGFSDATIATEPFTVGDVGREWTFNLLHGFEVQRLPLQGAEVSGGQLSEFRDFGLGDFDAEFALIDGRTILPDGQASGAIGASEDGKSLYVAAEAPLQNASIPGVPIGSESILIQVQTFIKRNDTASLTFSLPQTVIDAHDENAALGRECPPNRLLAAVGEQPEFCVLIVGLLSLDVEAFTPSRTVAGNPELSLARQFFSLSGIVELVGFAESWEFLAHTDATSRTPLWTREDFRLVVDDLDGLSESRALLTLINQPTHTVNISSIEVGETFHIRVSARASAFNLIAGPPSERRTSVGAYLRESLAIGGALLEFSGLEMIDTPIPLPEPPPQEEYVVPVVCPGSPNPAAGAIHFTAPGYTILETGSPPAITVARVGGSVGAVTATFTTSDGTAVAGADYVAVHSTVFFADGDTTPRAVQVPIIRDPAAGQPDKTVNLTLTEPGNCSVIGAQSAAVLTIRDADSPPPPPAFTVGGTVAGLIGTGLTLQDLHFVPITPDNGPFTFTLPTQSGQPYAVTILTQPANPRQVCTIANGSGIVGNANVTGVAVICAAPVVSGVLDPTFGGTGKVTTAFGGTGTAMALQSEGALVMVGGPSSDFALALYGSDGNIETTLTTDIASGADRAHGVAIQPDDKIVVVGRARVGTNDNFAIVRYNADGSLDPDFGVQGRVTTDFNGGADEAHGVVIQPDGKIVVVGQAATLLPGGTDFAIARYNSNGEVDSTFDGDGKVTVDIATGTDLGRNVVLQGTDILVSGLITTGGSPVLGHAGLARFDANGSLDAGFGANGKLVLTGMALGEAMVLQTDGKILVGGNAVGGGLTQFGLMRLTADGATDGSFGGGLVLTSFTTQGDFGYALALDASGRVLLAGQSSNQSNSNFAVARYTTDGALDTGFDSDGKLTVDFFDSFDGAESVLVQPDGKIVLGGFARDGATLGYGLVRINP